jgi:hypothetical protein
MLAPMTLCCAGPLEMADEVPDVLLLLGRGGSDDSSVRAAAGFLSSIATMEVKGTLDADCDKDGDGICRCNACCCMLALAYGEGLSNPVRSEDQNPSFVTSARPALVATLVAGDEFSAILCFKLRISSAISACTLLIS